MAEKEEDDIHVIEAVGRSKIVIQGGKVTEVSVSRLRCPLAKKFALPVDEITPDAVKANIEHRWHRGACVGRTGRSAGAWTLLASGHPNC